MMAVEMVDTVVRNEEVGRWGCCLGVVVVVVVVQKGVVEVEGAAYWARCPQWCPH